MVIKKERVLNQELYGKVPKNDKPFKLAPKAGGLYAFLPYDNMNNNGNALFKIGQATDFRRRMENYHTYYPEGVYIKNLLETPTQESKKYYKDMEGHRTKQLNKRMYYNEIEKFIFKDIIKMDGKQLHATTRMKNAINEKGIIKGETEWFYTNPDTLDHAFADVQKKFGGKQYDGDFDHFNADNKKNAREKRGISYQAEINYKIGK